MKDNQMLAQSPAAHTASTRRIAFFDVDETVVRFKTMFAFQDYYLNHGGFMHKLLGPWRARNFHAQMAGYLRAGRNREFINAAYYEGFRGRDPALVRRLALDWYNELLARGESPFFPSVLKILRKHQAEGTEVALVSGSSVDILAPFAEALGATYLLATNLEVVGGRYTGHIIPPQTIGAGKVAAVRTLLRREGVDRNHCFAYGDHHSDLPMLEEVAFPTIVSRDPAMIAVARERGWNCCDPLVEGE
jgi:HAD superfamily hydrolase (TIGR01490 family)